MSKVRFFKLPLLGRHAVISDRHGEAKIDSSAVFMGHLSAKVIRGMQYDDEGNHIAGTGYELPAKEVMNLNWLQRLLYGNKTEIDLGSGLVTNVGVLAMANSFGLAAPSGAAIDILRLSKWHASGTGATAAAATDIALQTVSTQGGQTPVAGTQVLVSAANAQKYQSVATIPYTGSEAVTEWGLFAGSTLSATTGSPFTATTAASATVTATPLTASSSTVQGQQQNIVVAGTTTVWGYITSNTTSVLSIPAWYKTADGTLGSTPGSTETYTLRPVMWDHKVFAAINVVNGDSIQYTYTLTINSGG